MVIFGCHNPSYIILGQNSININRILYQNRITMRFLRYYFNICLILNFDLPLCQLIFTCYAQQN